MPYVPKKYIPDILINKDADRQRKMLTKSRKMYKQGKYYDRKKLRSFTSKKSNHITKAQQMYGVKIRPTRTLAGKTGCTVKALQQIVKKGEGAYYSSGSRPNQTAHSWGYARLASALTSGKAASVDFHIIDKGCKHTGKAYKLALRQHNKHRKIHTRKTRL